MLDACMDRLRAGNTGSCSCCTLSALMAAPLPAAATGFTIPVALTAHQSLPGDTKPLNPTGCSSWTPVDTVSTEDMEWGRRKMDDGLPPLLLLPSCNPYVGSRAGSPAVREVPGERKLDRVGEPAGEPSSCGLVLKLAQREGQGLEGRSLARREMERRRMLSSRISISWPLDTGAVA
ncbi:hypothetical protein Vafri_7459 [Volvox africanus]|uniref:Uncharacterized protein n=1 Tax=Volvox africanus TaxID=51714 RepID=A0A8J4B4V7_9CHLO|nr:hypothetical protein Vafri_7459 [Volvox africanus]